MLVVAVAVEGAEELLPQAETETTQLSQAELAATELLHPSQAFLCSEQAEAVVAELQQKVLAELVEVAMGGQIPTTEPLEQPILVVAVAEGTVFLELAEMAGAA